MGRYNPSFLGVLVSLAVSMVYHFLSYFIISSVCTSGFLVFECFFGGLFSGLRFGRGLLGEGELLGGLLLMRSAKVSKICQKIINFCSMIIKDNLVKYYERIKLS
jgi:hypothetical protein